ncbi:MAG TPA: FecR family protein, partial [Desulfosarcina sp.]|nr:FecR family protein [Desulfosarcina sp.]
MRQGERGIVFLSVLGVFMALACGVADAGTEGPWVAEVTLAQGAVEVKPAGAVKWTTATERLKLREGDMLQVGADGRAAVRLVNGNLVRLDAHTTVTITGTPGKKSLLIRMLEGAAHFFSNQPRSLNVETPFVNAVVEGTEFLVRVFADNALVSVFHGQVRAENDQGSLTLTDGQSAVAYKGKAPALYTMVKQRDAAAWALYYPPVDDFTGLSDVSLPGLERYRE